MWPVFPSGDGRNRPQHKYHARGPRPENVVSVNETDPQGQLSGHKQNLVREISRYRQAKSSSERRSALTKISDSHRWCVDRAQVLNEMSSLRAYFRATNQYLVVSSDLIRELVDIEISQSVPIHKNVQGVSVNGMGVGSGKAGALFVPNAARGEVRFTIQGGTTANAIAAATLPHFKIFVPVPVDLLSNGAGSW